MLLSREQEIGQMQNKLSEIEQRKKEEEEMFKQ